MSTATSERRDWVPAAPFRAHVHRLMRQSGVPWPVVAFLAGTPLATVRTLVIGRGGKLRPRVHRHAAQQLIRLRENDLRRTRLDQVPAEPTGERIRLLRARGVSWAAIAQHLQLTQTTCQEIAQGRRTSCSVMVEILSSTACELAGILPWEDPTYAVSSTSTKTRSSTSFGKVRGSIGSI